MRIKLIGAQRATFYSYSRAVDIFYSAIDVFIVRTIWITKKIYGAL